MAAQRRTGAGYLLRVQGSAVVSPEQLVERIEARLAEVVVELDAAKVELAELAALACSSPGQEAGRGRRTGFYDTAEGWVFLAVPFDYDFTAFCGLIGRPDLATDERFSNLENRYLNRLTLGGILEPVFKTRSADEWERDLTEADLGCVRADAMGYRRFLYQDQHTRQIRFMVPTEHCAYADRAPSGRYWRHAPVVAFSETPCEEGKPFVAFGENTVQIMQELGYTESDIVNLREANVMSWPDNPPTGVRST